MAKIKVLLKALIVIVTLISLTPKVQAVPFKNACGDGGDFDTVRTTCDPIRDFTPDAYSQIPVTQDCSNYCFDTETGFASQEILQKTTVTCGEPIAVNLSRIGDFLEYVDDDFEITEDANLGAAGITGLSFDDVDREGQPVWIRLLNELGSVYSNLRGASDQEKLDYLDYGINVRTQSFEEQLQSRLAYCGNILQCQEDQWSDSDELTSNAPTMRRCVNPQPYQYIDGDPNAIAFEDEVCAQANDEFAYYLASDLGLSSYFIDCQQNPGSNCNPSYKADFAAKFLKIEPVYKSRELMVICTDKGYQSSSPFVNIFTNTLFHKFDCQEFIIPPGITAACQGVWNQYNSWSSKAAIDEITPRLEADIISLPETNGDQGPLVEYNPSIADRFSLSTEQINRLRRYATRINAQTSVNPDFTCDDSRSNAETYGDANLISRGEASSDTTRINTDIYISDSNRTGDSVEFEGIKRTYVIAPPEFSQCLSKLAYSEDLSLAKLQVSAKTYPDEITHEEPAVPNPLDLRNNFSQRKCEYVSKTTGEQILNPDSWLPPTDVEERCVEYKANLDNKVHENRFYTEGGANTRRNFLDIIGKVTKSFYDPEYAGNRDCGWYDYINGTITPGCEASTGFNTGVSGSGTGTCQEGFDFCDPNRLSATCFGENASNASQICQAESGSYEHKANISCLKGGNDFSIGLFQYNLWSTGARCPGAFNNHLIDSPKGTVCEIPDDGTDCSDLIEGMKDQPCNTALRSCIEHFFDPMKNIEQACRMSNNGENFSSDWVYASQACGIN